MLVPVSRHSGEIVVGAGPVDGNPCCAALGGRYRRRVVAAPLPVRLFVLIRCLIGLAHYMPVFFRYLRSFGQRTGRLRPVVVGLVLVLLGVALVPPGGRVHS